MTQLFFILELMTYCRKHLVENLIENIRKVAVKCMSHGISKVFVSAIVRNKRIPESVLENLMKRSLLRVRITIFFLLTIAISLIFIYLMTAFAWWNRVDVF